MTAAEVTTAAGPPGTAGQPRGGLARPGWRPRLAWLHLRSRRVPGGGARAGRCAAPCCAPRCTGTGRSAPARYAQQVPLIIEAGAAAVIAVTSHSPFGEAERATGRWLPYLRLGAAAGMTGLAIGAASAGRTGEGLNEGVLVLARNVIGITGIGLLCSLVTGGLLAWTLPWATWRSAEYALLEGLDRPVDLAGPPARRPWRLDLRRARCSRPAWRRSPSAAPVPASPTTPSEA